MRGYPYHDIQCKNLISQTAVIQRVFRLMCVLPFRSLFFFFSTHNARVSHFYALALDQRLNRLNYRHSFFIEETESWGIGLQRFCHPPRSVWWSRGQGWKPGIFSPVLATLQWHLDHLEKVKVTRADRAVKYLRCAVENVERQTSESWDVAHGRMGWCIHHYSQFSLPSPKGQELLGPC